MTNQTPMNTKRTFLQGAAWAIAMRWTIKALGLLSTLLLARILSPVDYGVVAMSMLVVGLIESFMDFGVENNILRLSSVDRNDIDSAWTLRIIQGFIVAVLLSSMAPLTAIYFKEPRIVWIIQVLSVCILIANFSNIGIVLARREFQFGLEYRYYIINKIIGVTVTITTALIIRDYRALVLGIASGYITGFVLSFLMHPYRPKWNISRIRSMWSFGKWMIVYWIANFAARKADEIFAGRMSDAHGLGIYSVSSDIGQMATAEIGPPMMRSLLPTLSSIQNDPERMKLVFLKTLGAINSITLVLGFGLAAVATPATLVLLGEKWKDVADVLAVFAIIGAIKISVIAIPTVLIVLGQSKIHALLMWIEFLVFLLAAFFLIQGYDIIGLAYARLISVVFNFIFNIFFIKKQIKINIIDIVAVFWRPVVGVLMMVSVIHMLPLDKFSPFFALLVSISIGAAVYVVWIFSTWMLVGHPDGIENLILQSLKKIWARRS